jgi:hypothetical protein
MFILPLPEKNMGGELEKFRYSRKENSSTMTIGLEKSPSS